MQLLFPCFTDVNDLGHCLIWCGVDLLGPHMMDTCHNAWLVKAISKCLRSKKKGRKRKDVEAPFLLCVTYYKNGSKLCHERF